MFTRLKTLLPVMGLVVAIQVVTQVALVRPAQAESCLARYFRAFVGTPQISVAVPRSALLELQLNELRDSGRMMERIWLLEQSGLREDAARELVTLEKKLQDSKIVRREPVGDGVTRPERAIFEDGTVGVLKMDTGSYAGNVYHELAAYRLDRLFDFRIVPATVPRKVNELNPAIVQFWVKKSGPAVPELVSRSAEKMRLFDLMIGNMDRHGGNQVKVGKVFAEKQFVAIDHGLAFCGPEFRLPKDLLKIVPPYETFLRLKEIPDARLIEELTPYLLPQKISLVLMRKKKLVEALEHYNYSTGKVDRSAYEKFRQSIDPDRFAPFKNERSFSVEDLQQLMPRPSL